MFVPDWLKTNAYRVLHIPAGASLTEVHKAATSMRRAVRLGAASATEADVPVLGEISRTEAGIRVATGRPENPTQRIFDGSSGCTPSTPPCLCAPAASTQLCGTTTRHFEQSSPRLRRVSTRLGSGLGPEPSGHGIRLSLTKAIGLARLSLRTMVGSSRVHFPQRLMNYVTKRLSRLRNPWLWQVVMRLFAMMQPSSALSFLPWINWPTLVFGCQRRNKILPLPQ